MDELDDMVLLAFFLWGAFAACRFAASVLHAKAELLARTGQPATVTQTAQDTTSP